MDGNETTGNTYDGRVVKTNPSIEDTDEDGRSDYIELFGVSKSHPLLEDTDGDGLSDGEEIDLGLDPLRLIRLLP